MLWRLAQNNVSPIGVDFGCDSLKLLQVTADDRPRLVGAASIGLPEDVRGNLEKRGEFVRENLSQLISQGGFKGKRVIISIPAVQTHVQHLRLNKTDNGMFDKQVEAELRRRLPVDPSCLVIRTFNVGEVLIDGAARQEVICLAAGRSAVMQYLGDVNKSRLQVVGMHCEQLAIIQGFAHLFRREDDVNRTTFFIDIGSGTTKALIAHGSKLVFAKTIQVAGDHFDRQLAGQLEVSKDQARRRRRSYTDLTVEQSNDKAEEVVVGSVNYAGQNRRGAAAPPGMKELAVDVQSSGSDTVSVATADPAGGQSDMVDSQENCMAVSGEVLDCLIDELQLCVGYHASVFPDRQIENIVFLGGEANSRQLCQSIAKALGLPAQLGDPLTRLERTSASAPPVGVDLREAQPGWSVPFGLCLLPTNL